MTEVGREVFEVCLTGGGAVVLCVLEIYDCDLCWEMEEFETVHGCKIEF
jgi:hypothetical protein